MNRRISVALVKFSVIDRARPPKRIGYESVQAVMTVISVYN